MLRVLAVCAGLALVTACAGPTPYQPADTAGRGYQEVRIEQDRYRVSFSGNTLTDRETVETYLLYRAAELTLERGFDHFSVVQRATDTERRTQATGPYYGPWHHSGFWVHYRYFHPRYGWYGWYDPFWDDRRYRETTRYEASAEIVMGRGARPDGVEYFDAREVTSNLGPRIQRPVES
ncbi:MAG: hypothetical protein KIS81_05190 [Maricaulaceae bacterium]|nr:hypothetical protein [Maricaulaceae bacterium]